LKAVRLSNIDVTEADAIFMTDFCVASIAGPSADRILTHQYQEALLCNDALGLRDTLQMFSIGRQRWIPERAATPQLLRITRHQVQSHKSALMDVKVQDGEERAEFAQESKKPSRALDEALWVAELRKSQLECAMKLEKLAEDVQLLQRSLWQGNQVTDALLELQKPCSGEGVNLEGLQDIGSPGETSNAHPKENLKNTARSSSDGSLGKLEFALQLQNMKVGCHAMQQRMSEFMQSTQELLEELRTKVAGLDTQVQEVQGATIGRKQVQNAQGATIGT